MMVWQWIIVVCAIGMLFCAVYAIIEKKMGPDGVLKVDRTHEDKDVFTLEVWCPLDNIEKRKSIYLKIMDMTPKENKRSQ